MSYQVLARKWRPASFSEVAGQSHVLKSLINALDNGRLHHAYLFTGTRGVGKTTLARILARCLNCEKGISSTPCGECEACTEIAEGRFIDLIEVDAASRTKVEDTRELLENVQYTPARGRFKVYLIDEVHMLSNHSFNALLKTLEEPPPHVKFLFATTDPQKLPITILSRCLQFNLKNLSPALITQHLGQVLDAEKISYEEEALWQIAASAAGSMRDALTLSDQAIAYCEGKIKADGVVDMLGVPAQRQVLSLLETMASGDAVSLLEQIKELSSHSPDYAHTLDALLDLVHRVAIAQIEPKAVDNSFGDREAVLAIAKKLAPEDAQLFFQIGGKGREELRFAADVHSTFEMLLIRMLLFSPRLAQARGDESTPQQAESAAGDEGEPTVDAAPEKKKTSLNDKEHRSDEQTGLAQESPAGQATVSQAETVPAAQQQAAADEGVDQGAEAALAAGASTLPQPAANAEQEPLPQAEPSSPKKATGTDDHERWLETFPDIGLSGIVANVLANCAMCEWGDERFHFLLDRQQSAVFSEELLPKLQKALSKWQGKPMEVLVEVAEVNEETPAQRAGRLKLEAQQALVEDFTNDQRVRELVERFSASVDQQSIRPIKPGR